MPESRLRRPRGTQPVHSTAAHNRNVLVINTGSSSLKFKVFQLNNDTLNTSPSMGGMVERIGDEANSVLLAKAVVASGMPQKWEIKAPVRSEWV